MHTQQQIPAAHEAGDMPVLKAHNDMVARVLTRHKLDQLDLALKAQCSESTISRIINGTRAVTAEIIRAIWELTADPEIIVVTLGSPNLICIQHLAGSIAPEHIEALAVRSCAKVLSDHGQAPASSDQAMSRVKDIDATIAALAALRGKMLGHARVAQRLKHANPQAQSAYRTLAHPASHGLNEVA